MLRETRLNTPSTPSSGEPTLKSLRAPRAVPFVCASHSRSLLCTPRRPRRQPPVMTCQKRSLSAGATQSSGRVTWPSRRIICCSGGSVRGRRIVNPTGIHVGFTRSVDGFVPGRSAVTNGCAETPHGVSRLARGSGSRPTRCVRADVHGNRRVGGDSVCADRARRSCGSSP